MVLYKQVLLSVRRNMGITHSGVGLGLRWENCQIFVPSLEFKVDTVANIRMDEREYVTGGIRCRLLIDFRNFGVASFGTQRVNFLLSDRIKAVKHQVKLL